MYEEITYKEWIDTYKPILNKNEYGQNYVSVQGEETYGAFDVYNDNDREILQNTDFKYIWTLTTEDNHDYLLSGIHIINRMEYYICEIPFDENKNILIDMGEEEWKNLQCLKI